MGGAAVIEVARLIDGEIPIGIMEDLCELYTPEGMAIWLRWATKHNWTVGDMCAEIDRLLSGAFG